MEHNQNTNATINHQRAIRIKFLDHSGLFHQLLKKLAVVEKLIVSLRNRTGEERRRQTLCDKRDNNLV